MRLLVGVALLLSGRHALAGGYFETARLKLWSESGALRIEGLGRGAVIVKDGSILVIDNGAKTFTEFDVRYFRTLARDKTYGRPSVTATPRIEARNGQACRIWEARRSGALEAEICARDFNLMEGGSEVVRGIRSARDLAERINVSPATTLGLAVELVTTWASTGDLPVFVRSFVGGEPAGQDELLTSRRMSVPAEMFKPPLDYTSRPPAL